MRGEALTMAQLAQFLQRLGRPVIETFEFDDPAPNYAIVAPLFGCMEGNMGHAVQRKPIDVPLARREEIQQCGAL